MRLFTLEAYPQGFCWIGKEVGDTLNPSSLIFKMPDSIWYDSVNIHNDISSEHSNADNVVNNKINRERLIVPGLHNITPHTRIMTQMSENQVLGS